MIKNIAALLFGICLSLFILEGALRIHNPLPFRVKGNQIVLQANRVITVDNPSLQGIDARVVHTKNALGFRGPEKPKDFADRITIVAVGGSTTECYYLSDDKEWAGLVQKRLSAAIPSIWVNNAGLDGHSTFGHQVLLDEVIIPLKPTYVLFLVGCNDVGRSDLLQDKSNIVAAQSALKRLISKSELVYTVINLSRVLAAAKTGMHHGAFDLTGAGTLAVSKEERLRACEHHQQFLAAFGARLERLITQCRSNGIEPVLITQPSLVGIGTDPVTGADLAAVRTSDTANGALDWQVLECYNTVTRQTGAAHKVQVIDLARLMPKSSQYFYDEYHFTNDGAARVAALVVDALLPRLRNDTRSAR